MNVKTIISALALAAVISIGGVLVLRQMNQGAPPATEVPSDWLTYRNEVWGFEVRYPEGWNPTERIFEDRNLFNVSFGPNSYINILASLNQENLTARSFVESLERYIDLNNGCMIPEGWCFCVEQRKFVMRTVADQEALFCPLIQGPLAYQEYQIFMGEYVYMIREVFMPDDISSGLDGEIYQTMISTFHFLK